jgi:chromosome segregation ATPase
LSPALPPPTNTRRRVAADNTPPAPRALNSGRDDARTGHTNREDAITDYSDLTKRALLEHIADRITNLTDRTTRRLTHLERKMADLQQSVTDLQQSVTDLDAAVQNALTALNSGTVQDLKDQLAQAQADLAELQVQDDADKAALTESLQGAQDAADNIEAQVTALNEATGANAPVDPTA